MIRPLISAFFALLAAVAMAQGNTPPTVKVTLPKDAKPGSMVKGTVEVTFAEGLHGYQNPPIDKFQIPVSITADTKGFSLKVAYPKGVMKAIGGDPKPTGVYEGEVKFPITVTVPKTGGQSSVKITVHYQQCNDQTCYPPETVSSTAKILIKK